MYCQNSTSYSYCSPTLDLVGQWYDLLKVGFQEEIGIIGGGHHEIKRILSTYDSLISTFLVMETNLPLLFLMRYIIPLSIYKASKSAMALFVWV